MTSGLQAELEAARGEAAAAKSEVEAGKQQLADATAKLDAASSDVSQLKEKLAESEQQAIAAAESHGGTKSALKVKLADAELNVKSVQEGSDQLSSALETANVKVEKLEAAIVIQQETSASELATVKAALNDARSTSGNATGSLAAALAAAEDERDTLKMDVVKVRAELEDAERLTRQVEGLKTAVKAAHAEKTEAMAASASRAAELEELKPRLANAEASVAEYVASSDAKETELAQARSQAIAAQKTAAVLAVSVEETQAKVGGLEAGKLEVARLTAELEQVKETLGNATESGEAARKEADAMKAALAHVTENASSTSSDFDRLGEELKKAQQEVLDMRATSEAAAKDLADAKEEAAAAADAASGFLQKAEEKAAALESDLGKLQQVLTASEATVSLLNTEIVASREMQAVRESEIESLRASTARLETEHAKSESDFQMFEVQLLQKIGQLKAAHDANVAAIRTELMRRNTELQAEVEHFANEAEANKVSFEALALEQVTAEELHAKQEGEMATMRSELSETILDLEKGRTYLEETTTHISYLKGQVERLQESLDVAREQLEPFVQQGLVEHLRVIPINPRLPSVMAKVQISVPDVSLQNQDGDEFHSYEIQIVTADGSWTVHKRYSELLALHEEVIPRIRGSQVLVFPPKKTFGSKTEKLAEERRLLFREYLVMLVRLCTSDPRSPLHDEATKTAFLIALPFFGEETIAMGALDMSIADGAYE